MLDEPEPLRLIRFVQFVADFLLALCRLVEQGEGARLLARARRKQPATFEQAIKLVETVALAQFLQREFLVRERAFRTMIQANGREVGNDPPGTSRHGVEIVPALLDRSAAVRAVAVQVGQRSFEFDDGGGFARFREVAQGRVRRAHARHGAFVFQLPGVGAGSLDLVPEAVAEKSIEELRVD